MNLINRILSRFEKRGADAQPDGPVNPAVQMQKKRRSRAVGVLAAVLAVAVALAGWWWNSRSKVAPPVAEGAQRSSGALSPVAGGHAVHAPAKPVAALSQAASQPVVTTAPDAPQDKGKQGAVALDAELGRELAAASSPADFHDKPAAVATGDSHGPVAAPHLPAKKNKAPVKAQPIHIAGDGADKKADAREAEPPAESKTAAVQSAPASATDEGVDKRVRQISVQQQAENEFRRSNGLIQQGHTEEALAGYAAALQLDPGHDAARQAMVGLLLENKRNADAERVLEDGLKHNIKHSGFAMLLARLQVERGIPWTALLTLQKTLPYAERQADYQAFVAALLQRLDRHKEAIRHYQLALQLSPNSGVWLMGLGISLQAEKRNEDARDIFRRAIESKTLNAELQMFVKQRLKEL